MLRIFNAYGPEQPLYPGHPPVIPQVLQQTLWDGSVTINGSGMQVRDFVYIDDVVDSLIAAATAQGIDQRIINIGSGKGTSINELVHLIEVATRRQPQVLRINTESGGVSRLVADISAAKNLLDYEPQVSLREGLTRVLVHDMRFQRVKV